MHIYTNCLSMSEKSVVGLEMNNTADIEELPSHIGLYKSILLQFCKTVIIIAVVMGKNLSELLI